MQRCQWITEINLHTLNATSASIFPTISHEFFSHLEISTILLLLFKRFYIFLNLYRLETYSGGTSVDMEVRTLYDNFRF